MESKVYLLVPYEEKEEAKALGAKWDATEKSWYSERENENLDRLLSRWGEEREESDEKRAESCNEKMLLSMLEGLKDKFVWDSDEDTFNGPEYVMTKADKIVIDRVLELVKELKKENKRLAKENESLKFLKEAVEEDEESELER